MEVKDVLNLGLINTKLSVNNKEEALKKMIKMFEKEGYLKDKERFLEDVYFREEQGQTGIGNYIAIPHGKSSFVNKPGVAIGINDKEIEWETLDDKGVRVIILFAVVDDIDASNEHLKLLAMFARKLGKEEVVKKLLNSKTSQEVIEAFS